MKTQNGNLITITCSFCTRQISGHLQFIDEWADGWQWLEGIDCCPTCLSKDRDEPGVVLTTSNKQGENNAGV